MEKQHVLVAEDEAELQLIFQDVLEAAGFSVTMSASAGEATKYLEQSDLTFDALVTDVHLTKAGAEGWDIARRARELNGALPVVYITGAAAADWPVNGVPNSILVTKPFAPAQLITALSQLLNVGGPTAS